MPEGREVTASRPSGMPAVRCVTGSGPPGTGQGQ